MYYDLTADKVYDFANEGIVSNIKYSALALVEAARKLIDNIMMKITEGIVKMKNGDKVLYASSKFVNIMNNIDMYIKTFSNISTSEHILEKDIESDKSMKEFFEDTFSQPIILSRKSTEKANIKVSVSKVKEAIIKFMTGLKSLRRFIYSIRKPNFIESIPEDKRKDFIMNIKSTHSIVSGLYTKFFFLIIKTMSAKTDQTEEDVDITI